MKFKKLLLTFVFLIGSLLGLTSCKQEVLTVYTEVGFAPFEYVANGKISGVDVEIMNKVGEKLDKRVVFENVAFDSIIDAVSAGKLTNVGAAGLSITEERKAKVDFSQVYYQANLYVIYSTKNTVDKRAMTDGNEGIYWSSLQTNKGIGVQTGTTADLFLSDEIAEGGSLEGVNKTDYDSLDTAVSDIGLGIDYIIIDELPAKTLCSGYNNIACLPLYYEGDNEDILAYDEYAICVTKGETELLNAINEVLDELLVKDENGIDGVSKLVTSHLGIKDEKEDSNLFKDMYKILTVKEYRSYLFEGFLNTLIITIIAAIIGLVIGLIVAIIKIFATDNKYLKVPAVICNIYTTIIRGTPVALQLFIMVFALLAIPGFKVTAVILTFGINSGAYVSESIRAGIMSVDKGQIEAGRSLGFNYVQTMVNFVLPQAFKAILPSLANEFITLLKESSVAFAIGLGDLTFGGNLIRSTTYSPFLPLIAVAIIYLALVMVLSKLVSILERRLAKSDH